MINKIAADKWRHFFAGIIMGFILQLLLLWLWPEQLILTSIVSLTLVIAISYGFELFSKLTGKGRYDFLDAVASVIGGILGMGIVLIAAVLVS
jgi:hypothetical protein